MSKGDIAVQGQINRGVRARFWMTKESEWRLSNGGNSKGAVPVHRKPSQTAVIPLYDQAALDAAVSAERKACAARAAAAIEAELETANGKSLRKHVKAAVMRPN